MERTAITVAELIAALQKLDPETVVIQCTGQLDDYYVVTGLTPGVAPIDPKDTFVLGFDPDPGHPRKPGWVDVVLI